MHTLNIENLISDPENLVSNPRDPGTPVLYGEPQFYTVCRRAAETIQNAKTNRIKCSQTCKSSIVPLQDHCNFKEPSKHHMKSNINAEHEADQAASTVFQVFGA